MIKLKEKRNRYIEIATKQSKGITLIALIVTIVVMIVVAGVTINMTVGENGIFTKAVKAKEMQEAAEIKERLELKQLDARLALGGENMTLENYLKYLVDQGMIDESDIEDAVDSNTKTILVDDKYIYSVIKNDDGSITLEYEGKAGKLLPKIKNIEVKPTTNSITVKVDATRVDGGEYRFYIKDVASGEDYKNKQTNKTGEYTFTGLEQNKEFKVKVEVENKNGITEKETNVIRTVTVAELTQADLEFTYNPNDWTKDKIVVTVNAKVEIPTGYTLQTSKDMTNWENTITQEFTENGYMYVRLYDGINGGSYAVGEVTKIDKDAPTNVSITAGNVNNKIITLTANGKDSASKIKEYQFYVDGKLEKTVTTAEESTNYKYTSTFGNHTGYVVVVDKAENRTTSSTINFSDYTIKTVQEMATFRNSVNNGTTYEGKTVTLLNDIDLNSVCSASIGSWEPIGTVKNKFRGKFNGNSKNIKNLYIDSSSSFQGLFGFIEQGEILNVNVYGSITNTQTHTGGIAGMIKIGKIENCKNYANVTADSSSSDVPRVQVAGIIGYGEGIDIKKCINYGEITSKGGGYIGGIIASSWGNGKVIEDCINYGKITGYEGIAIGGIAGNIGENTIQRCVNKENVISEKGACQGGIVGGIWQDSGGEIIDCYNIGRIEGKNIISGICGENKSNIDIENCYTIGQIVAKTDASALANEHNGAIANIENSYFLDTCGAAGSGTSKTETELRGLASTLGSEWVADEKDTTTGKWKYNNGYPILKFEIK